LSSGDGLDSALAPSTLDARAPVPEGTAQSDAGSASPRDLDAEVLGAWIGDAPFDAPFGDASDVVVADSGAPDARVDAGVDVTCPAGEIVCAGACVDPSTDPLNCNGCGNVCNDGLCGTSIAADMHGAPSSAWVFNGTAQYSGDQSSAALTVADVLYQAGSMNYRNAIAVDSFTAKFQFRMGYGGGSRNDGMGFMFQKTGPTALSGAGQALGMVGLDGYGVELDLVDNGACGDVSNDHVGVDSLAGCAAVTGLPTSLYSTDLTGVVDLADAAWHDAVVDLAGGTVSIAIDGSKAATQVALPGFVEGTTYYFGFAGATGGNAGGPDGGGGYRTEVREVEVTFPTARCL
jgi:hypothetical protein